jgi:serine/threonine protein kinase
MAPEMILDQVQPDHSTKVDVYSFGIIMYETFFEKQPYHKENQSIDSIVTLGMRVVKNERPEIPEDSKNPSDQGEKLYLELMQHCWSVNPESRPSFNDIFNVFEEILSFSK